MKKNVFRVSYHIQLNRIVHCMAAIEINMFKLRMLEISRV